MRVQRYSDLDDVVFAEHTAGVSSVSVLSDGALQLMDRTKKHFYFPVSQHSENSRAADNRKYQGNLSKVGTSTIIGI